MTSRKSCGQDVMPQELINAVQKHTGHPWWNGKAYAEFKGLPQRIANLEQEVGHAIDDIYDVMEWLRCDGRYQQSDRLRTVLGRLARALDSNDQNHELIRVIAKGWK